MNVNRSNVRNCCGGVGELQRNSVKKDPLDEDGVESDGDKADHIVYPCYVTDEDGTEKDKDDGLHGKAVKERSKCVPVIEQCHFHIYMTGVRIWSDTRIRQYQSRRGIRPNDGI